MDSQIFYELGVVLEVCWSSIFEVFRKSRLLLGIDSLFRV
jgi:hypothetical protein